MKLSKALVAAATMSLVTAPIAAQAANAAVGPARVSSEIEGENTGGAGWLIPALAAIAVILGIIVAAGGSGERPTSP